MPASEQYNVVENIMAYEQGDLDEEQTLELFQHLIESGMIWNLQGCYGRAAKAMGLI